MADLEIAILRGLSHTLRDHHNESLDYYKRVAPDLCGLNISSAICGNGTSPAIKLNYRWSRVWYYVKHPDLHSSIYYRELYEPLYYYTIASIGRNQHRNSTYVFINLTRDCGSICVRNHTSPNYSYKVIYRYPLEHLQFIPAIMNRIRSHIITCQASIRRLYRLGYIIPPKRDWCPRERASSFWLDPETKRAITQQVGMSILAELEED